LSEQENTPDDAVRIRDAKQAIDRDYLILGRELYVAFSSGKYKEDGHESFEDYAIAVGVEPGRAKRLRRVFKKFSQEIGVSFERMLDVGYERLKAIEPVINRSNKDLWMNRAKTLRFSELTKEVKANKVPRRRRKEIKQSPGSMLHGIFQPESAASLIAKIEDDRLKPSADGTVVTDDDIVFVKTLYLVGEDQNRVFETAIENMERRTGSTKVGYLLVSALQEFLALEATRGIKDDKRMRYYMNILERRYKGRLLWVRDKKVAARLAELIGEAEAEVEAEKESDPESPDQA